MFLIHVVLFRDFLDGDAYLVAQVPPRVHHAILAFTQNHVIAVLISLINVLLETKELIVRKCFLFLIYYFFSLKYLFHHSFWLI